MCCCFFLGSQQLQRRRRRRHHLFPCCSFFFNNATPPPLRHSPSAPLQLLLRFPPFSSVARLFPRSVHRHFDQSPINSKSPHPRFLFCLSQFLQPQNSLLQHMCDGSQWA